MPLTIRGYPDSRVVHHTLNCLRFLTTTKRNWIKINPRRSTYLSLATRVAPRIINTIVTIHQKLTCCHKCQKSKSPLCGSLIVAGLVGVDNLRTYWLLSLSSLIAPVRLLWESLCAASSEIKHSQSSVE